MNHENLPQRVILNFAHRCAMNCEWCYVPFESAPARKEIVLSIVDRISDLGFSSITFGGGDPFQYRFSPEVLRHAKSLNLFVHVDTHGKSLLEKDENLDILNSSVDLLGLPLDGSTAQVHDLMRSSPGHFSLICQRLNWLKNFRRKIKLNTIISSVNILNFLALCEFVKEYSPGRWSVYQYWPLGPAANVKLKHQIGDPEFVVLSEIAKKILSIVDVVVEVNSRELRRDTYPILHHDGEVFVHSVAPSDTLISLGSIFDKDIMGLISLHCSSERVVAASRYLKK